MADRRRFLTLGGAAAAGALFGRRAVAQALETLTLPFDNGERRPARQPDQLALARI